MSARLRLIALLLSLPIVAGCGGSDSDTDNDTDPDINLSGTFVFGDDSYTVFENEGVVTITVDRTEGTAGDVTVDYATADGTATAGADYETAIGTLAFADGEASRSVDITVIDNPDVNDTRDFDVALSNPTGGAGLGVPATTTISILNEEESVAVYDFELLAEGDINGQDNWVEPVTNATVVTDTTAENGSRVVRPQSTVEGQAGETQISRANDASFSYAALTAGTAEIQFDVTGDDNGVFSLGRDLNGDGMLSAADNELGVPFGFWERQLAIFTANSLNIRAGNVPVAEGEESTHWYRVRLRIDFTANGGDGAGSLSYLNLTNGETVFRAPPELQDLNLRILTNGAPDPASWNAMFLLLRIDASNIPKADNLVPNLPGNAL